MLGRQLRHIVPIVRVAVDGRHPSVFLSEVDGLYRINVARVVSVNMRVPTHALYRPKSRKVHALFPARSGDYAGASQCFERSAKYREADEVDEDRDTRASRVLSCEIEECVFGQPIRVAEFPIRPVSLFFKLQSAKLPPIDRGYVHLSNQLEPLLIRRDH